MSKDERKTPTFEGESFRRVKSRHRLRVAGEAHARTEAWKDVLTEQANNICSEVCWNDDMLEELKNHKPLILYFDDFEELDFNYKSLTLVSNRHTHIHMHSPESAVGLSENKNSTS